MKQEDDNESVATNEDMAGRGQQQQQLAPVQDKVKVNDQQAPKEKDTDNIEKLIKESQMIYEDSDKEKSGKKQSSLQKDDESRNISSDQKVKYTNKGKKFDSLTRVKPFGTGNDEVDKVESELNKLIDGKRNDTYQVVTDMDNSKYNLIVDDDNQLITNYNNTLLDNDKHET